MKFCSDIPLTERFLAAYKSVVPQRQYLGEGQL
jgi:hypothetical protein